jgi:hypothetical protein
MPFRNRRTRYIGLMLLVALALTAVSIGLGYRGHDSRDTAAATTGPVTTNAVSASDHSRGPNEATTDDKSSPGATGGRAAADYRTDRDTRASDTTVRGHVTVAATGAPYAGATVEFKDVSGGNVHTETAADGSYSVTVPAGVHTALALDLNDTNASFDVVGRSTNAVEVPTSSTVDFSASPIN